MPAINSKPWYHYPFVWLLFGLPTIAVVAGLITFLIAARTDDGLVAEDYYTQGKEINRDLRRDAAAARMGLSARIVLGADRRNLRIMFNHPVNGNVQIRLVHPTRAGLDQVARLTEQGPQMWVATFSQSLEQPRWHVEISDEAGIWHLHGEWQIQADQALELRPLLLQ